MPCHLIQARFASVPSCPTRPCPKFRGSRSWLLTPRRASGVRWFLPRIRRSPCETDSAAAGTRSPRAPWNKWKGPASAQCSEAGVGSGPFMPRKAIAPGRAALGFAPEAADERRGADDRATGRFGPCAIARGPSHVPARARWPATNFRWKSSLRSAQRVRKVQPSKRFIMGKLCLPCACVPRGPHRAPAGRRHDRQSNDLSPAIGCSDGAGGNFHLTDDLQ